MTKRKSETWTFQPDNDIVILFKALFGEEPSRGQRTKLINEAIRFCHPESLMMMAEQEVTEANARLERMRAMLTELKKLNSSEKGNQILGKSRAKILNKRKADQTKLKVVPPNPQSPPEKAQ